MVTTLKYALNEAPQSLQLCSRASMSALVCTFVWVCSSAVGALKAALD